MTTPPPADLDFLDQWSRGCLYARHFLEVQAAVAELRRLRASVETLLTALLPFASVGVPENWPPGCVVDWREGEGPKGRYAYVCYLPVQCQGGPTVADHLRAERVFLGAGGREWLAEAVEPDPHLWEHGEGLEGGR